jgi:hypothetical protein
MMKLLALVLGASVALAAAPVFAGPPGETPPAGAAIAVDGVDGVDGGDYYGGNYVDRGGQRERMRAIRKRIKARFDADGDGRLSREERRDARAAIGPRLAHHKQRMHKLKMLRKLIRKLDRDGDGVVGPGEAPARLVRKLKRFDKNGDGWVDAQDFRGRGRGVR